MDQSRITRFITPSAFFLASLLFGLWSDAPQQLGVLCSDWSQSSTLLAGAIAASLFPLGFAITAVFTTCLRAVFRLAGRTYQISLSEDAWKKVWSVLRLPEDLKKTRASKVSVGLTFDHEILHERVHAASVRLWSAFNVAAASCTSLILAVSIGHLVLHIQLTSAWILFSASLFLLFAVVAVVTWREMMGLFELQVHRYYEQQKSTQSSRSNPLGA